ncbi:MAG TPA: hypothetical protein ENN81_03945 [Phycisphaerales bacterium]|nr:hypothetical protein [Phycisphaerales bacterium]
MRASVIATVVAVLIGACTAGGKVIYVDDDANSPGDGASWATAYKYLQDALADANSSPKPVEIRVAQGLYRPDRSAAEPNGTGDRLASFGLVSGVALIGGYAGLGAADPNARDPRLYETILSGDLGGDDAQGMVAPEYMTENTYTVVSCVYSDATTVLEGFIVTGASTEGPLHHVAQALRIGQSDANIRHCTFAYNCGTGVLVSGGTPRFDNCRFIGNVSRMSEVRNEGAGMVSIGEASPIVTNCVFAGNWATGEHGSGGGFWRGQAATLVDGPRLINCTFTGNRAARGRAVATGGRDGGDRVQVLNSILWDGGNEVFDGDHSLIIVAYSTVEGWSGVPNPLGETVVGLGNLAEDPCLADPGYWDTNGTPDDPNDDFWVHGDYHLKSQAGRWVSGDGRWTMDDVTSPCIDAGDPMSALGLEPFPNGGRVNMGAYGGTAEASKSWFGGPVCQSIVAGDINGDCRVDLADLAILARHWMAEGNR